ncbi:hypothetical protein C8F01DRAFT_1242815 [Mycena amicta]|nr:hypothetical protein C8F01DRAFT_1242815 [Mycena amicta]
MSISPSFSPTTSRSVPPIESVESPILAIPTSSPGPLPSTTKTQLEHSSTPAKIRNPNRIRIRFEYLDCKFTIEQKPNLPLAKALDVFTKDMKLDRSALRFCYLGERVRDTDTPDALGMPLDEEEDVHIIEVHLLQVGG